MSKEGRSVVCTHSLDQVWTDIDVTAEENLLHTLQYLSPRCSKIKSVLFYLVSIKLAKHTEALPTC
jgi:hypothetical protein